MNAKLKPVLLLMALSLALVPSLTAAAPINSGRENGQVTLYVDKTLYPQGQMVRVTLHNGSKKSVTRPSGAPWSVTDADGDTVYRPRAIQKLSTLRAGQSLTWTWDQIAENGKHLNAGLYSVSSKTSAGELRCDFFVSGLKKDVDVDNPDPEFKRLPNPFKDVTGKVEWGDAHILRLAQLGIVQGKSANTFEPDARLSRAEFVALLLRAAGLAPASDEEFGESISFDDLPPKHWAYEYVSKATDLGIVTRAEYRRKFEPEADITRLEISIMLTRALGLDAEAMEDGGSKLPFRDAKDVPPLYRGYVLRALEGKVLKGYDDNTFRPNRPATRREACVMLYRVLLNP